MYRVSARQALFAVVGDFNGDGIPDVVVDGDNKTYGRLLAILSSAVGFQVSEIESGPRISRELEAQRGRPVTGRDEDEGIPQGLSLAQRGTIRSHHEPAPLVLRTEAVNMTYFESSAKVVYYRNGAWHDYWTSD